MRTKVLLISMLILAVMAPKCKPTDQIDANNNVFPDPNQQDSPSDNENGQTGDNDNGPGGEPSNLVARIDDERLKAADTFFYSLGARDTSQDQFFVESAPEGDNIHGTGQEPGGYTPSADIIYTGNFILKYPDGRTIDDFLTCGYQNPHLNLQVLCSADREPPTTSRYSVSWYSTIDPIPVFDQNQTISLFWGFDSDGEPENNLAANENFPLDFWQGLDRIHAADYQPQVGWGYTIYANFGAGFDPQPSSSIMVTYENLVALVVPDTEVDPDIATSNGGIHIHSGDWSVESTGANTAWTGNPQEPLRGFNQNSQIDLALDLIEIHTAPDLGSSVTYCGMDLCDMKFAGFGSSDTLRYWCACDGCTNQEDCTCKLFQQFSISFGMGGSWIAVADQEEEYSPLKFESYRCFCVK